MPQTIAIIDYQMGNLHSVYKRLKTQSCIPTIVSDATDILNADKIILPGVGHFAKAMQQLKELNLLNALNEAVLGKKKPILGICLGMQLMAKQSAEGNAEGLGWFDADVVRFNIHDTLKYKVPHMGWNQVINRKESPILHNIPDQSEFYFVHAYHFRANNPHDILHETDYETRFISAVAKDNIFGVQYHPEKSHDVGQRLLKNFIKL